MALPPAAGVVRRVDDLTLAPGEHRDLRLEVLRGARLAGRVLDGDGRPLADADVQVRRSRETFGQAAPGELLRETQSDALGRFELSGVEPVAVQLSAAKSGYLAAPSAVLELGEGEARADLELRLGRGGQIAGRVVLPGGKPAAGAVVTADHSELLRNQGKAKM